jgi:hypothetical protein
MKLKLAGNQLQMRAAFEPSSFNADKSTVELVWTTGARGPRYSWDEGRYLEELAVTPEACDMTRLNNGAPLLNSHSAYSLSDVVGVVERAWIDNGVGRATVRFSDRAEVQPIKDDVQKGILRHISVGYRVNKYEKVEETDGVPVYRATSWQPFEISLVPMGFDDAAVTRTSEKSTFHEVEVQTRGEAPQKEQRTMETEQEKAARLAREADEATRKAETLEAEKEKVRKEELSRAAEIRALTRKVQLADAVAEELITKGTTLEQARAIVIDKVAERSESIKTENHPRIEVGASASEKFCRAAEAGMLHRYGFGDMAASVSQKARWAPKFEGVVKDNGGEFRGMRVSEMARRFLELEGQNTRGLSERQIVERALTFNRGGAQTGSDFSVLLENTMYKVLLGQYALADDTWRSFCGTDTVQDFRPANRYRTGSFGTLPVIPEMGEYPRLTIPDGSKTQISTETRGAMIAVSRQALINDDMGAILDSIGKFGRAVGLSIESDVYAQLTANAGLGFLQDGSTAFFSSGNKNLNATGSALSVDALDADRVVLSNQKDPSNNEFLNLAKFGRLTLVVPVSLGGEARVINKNQYDFQSSVFQKQNKVQGLFREIVDTPRLTGTRRYMFADPSDACAIKVVFLNGEQSPFMEQRLGWQVDGTEWKLRMDYKVLPFDPKGAVTNAGV